MNHSDFISLPKSLLIAPAGYGKTHTIAECLKHTQGRQLIITHTHAGVASLKEKLTKENIPSDRYDVETITSFCQKYHKAFYVGNNTPAQDSRGYYPFVIDSANKLVKLSPIKEVIRATYKGLFVDEYQDCTLKQHEFISSLAETLPARLLGDPLQGIFGINNEKLVNWDSDLDLYKSNKFELSIPRRWEKSNIQLGITLKEMRAKLLNTESINLADYKGSLEFNKFKPTDLFIPRSEYYKEVTKILNSESNVLIIYPDSERLHVRVRLVKVYGGRLYLAEAIDAEDFYLYAKKLDNLDTQNTFQVMKEILRGIFHKGDIDAWFGAKAIKKKDTVSDQMKVETLKIILSSLENNYSPVFVSQLLDEMKKLGAKLSRHELFVYIKRASKYASINNLSIYDAMCQLRNQRRRVGGKFPGHVLGTTLLTKGLEFDTVIVLDAHRFTDPKNFYVAITRASRRLIIFSEQETIYPYTKI